MKIRGAVTGNVKFWKFKSNLAERFNTNMEGVNKMRAFVQGVRYYESKAKQGKEQ